MRNAFAVLCSCVLLVFCFAVSPASAGEYYNGYYPRYRGNVWYSSDCCYKKIVRHVREVRYVRTWPVRRYGCCGPDYGPRYGYGPYRPYREGYYAPYRPYREGYYGRPASYTEVYVGPARRFEGYPPGYPGPRYYNGRYGNGYDAYNSADIPAVSCHWRRTPVLDGKGGWVWGFKRACN